MEQQTTTQPWMRIAAAMLLVVAVWLLTSSLAEIRSELAAVREAVAHLEEEVHELRRPVAAEEADDDHPVGSHAEPAASLLETEFDFGLIRPQDGAVSTTFTIGNTGEGVLTFGTITTSCACTSAEADATSVAPGEEATVTVTFDPNVHEEPEGRFSRSAYIPTNDHDMPEIELTVFVDVIENE